MDKRQRKWDLRFLDMAREVSTWSKDPSTRCGAVIVRPDRTIVSLGFNGFPRGTTDAPEELEDRTRKYAKVIHAEMNALLSARESLRGYTLYSWPPGHGPTCERCAAHVIQSGVARVVGIRCASGFATRWRESCENALRFYSEAGVQVEMIDELEAVHGVPR